MANPPNDYNTDINFNKFKGTYFNDDIDVSGGDIINRTGNLYLAPNSNIYTSDNQITFNEEFQFTDFANNVNVLGQLKNTYNSVSYDVGLQCEKTDELVSDVATLSPIISDTAFKCTNFYYDQTLNSTIFSNNVSFGNSTIASIAINNTSFVDLTNNQTISGVKTFNSAPFMGGANITAGSIAINKVTGTAVNLNTAQSIIATKSYSVVQNFNNNIRLDGSLLLSLGTITLTNADLQKIAFINTATSNIQTQINTLITNSVSLSASNIFTGATNQFSNTLRLDGALNLNANALVVPNTTLQKIQYLSTVSSDVQTQINTLTTNSGSLSASNIFTGATNQFTNTLRLDGALNLNANALVVPNTTLQKIQYLSTVSSDVQTQINTLTTNSGSLSASNVFTGATNQFTNTLRLDGALNLNANALVIPNTTLQKIQYLSTVSSDIQTQITGVGTRATTLETKTTKMSYMSVGGINTTTILDGLISQTFSFTGTINNISTTTFAFINSLTSNAQAQLTNLATKLTAISYEASNTTTTIAGDLIFLNNLNSISATTFGYLSGLTSAIQSQLNSLSTRIATFELVGTIIMSPLSDLHTTSGNKYLHCTGQNVSRTTYSALFAKILTNFGAGDGSTTFTLPNYQGLFFRGMGGQVINGTTYTGIAVNSAQQDAVQDHQHGPQSGAYLGTSTSASNSGGYLNSPLQRPNPYNFDNTGAMISGRPSSTETRPVNVGIYYYIKT